MNDLSYFNLGFRSDNIFNQLSTFKTDGLLGEGLINEAVSIVKDFLLMEQKEDYLSFFSTTSEYNASVLTTLLCDLFPTYKAAKIVEKLNTVLTAVSSLDVSSTTHGKIEYDEKGIDEAINFFSKLADACLSKSANSLVFKGFVLQ